MQTTPFTSLFAEAEALSRAFLLRCLLEKNEAFLASRTLSKRLIAGILIVLAMGFSLSTRAQDMGMQEKPKEVYGLKAGVNFAELWGDDARPESDRKVGYSFGIFGFFSLTEALGFQPELIWSLQGEKSGSKGRYDIAYLNIPLMLKWKHGRFSSEVGPQIGLLTVNTSKSVADELQLNDLETLDIGINIGLAYALANEWSLGLRYTEGLRRIAPGTDLRNSVFYLGLAYTLF